jgi:hypothetical protein
MKGADMSKRIGEDSALLSIIGHSAAEPEESEQKPAEKKAAVPKPKPKARNEIRYNKRTGEEIRDKAITFMLQPSLVQEFRDEAYRQRRSANDLAEEIIRAYLKKRR